MGEMTIKEFKEKKSKLENDILDLITTFEENVDFSADHIQLERAEFMDGKRKCISVKIDIYA